MTAPRDPARWRRFHLDADARLRAAARPSRVEIAVGIATTVIGLIGLIASQR